MLDRGFPPDEEIYRGFLEDERRRLDQEKALADLISSCAAQVQRETGCSSSELHAANDRLIDVYGDAFLIRGARLPERAALLDEIRKLVAVERAKNR